MQTVKTLTAPIVTENQQKVIKDKYLRDAPSVQAWLEGVAMNIALGEILYCGIPEEKIFEGVTYDRVTYETRGSAPTVIYHLHANHKTMDEQKQNFRRFMKNLYTLAEHDPRAREVVQRSFHKFYDLLANWKFLPNSPTLMNAGRDLQQLSACYVLPVGDSIKEIYTSVMHMAIIHQSGGGTGFDFSRLRPSGSNVQSTKGVASGPITFMQLFDKSTEVVKQGGTRRGANMGIMRYDHPDIDSFIDMKKTPGVMENFNVSVTITEDFMAKVKAGEDYDLLDPKTKKVVGKKNAREMWNKLVQGAWETGDPGIIMIDRINNSRSNPVPAQGMIESTNPCGEQPLLPYEPCNLGSLNLAKFVKHGDFDWYDLKEAVHDTIHFLDNVVTVNNYPIKEIEEIAKRNRRIGLGVMGWAEALVLLGLAYSSDAALKKAEQLMHFINDESMKASEELAKTRGAFGGYVDSIFDKDGANFRGEYHRPRNSARTTIAPTGTIGIAAGLQGAGIEPFFAVVYTRFNAKALDALKRGQTPDPKDTFWEVNPLFEKIAAEHHYFGLTREELFKKVDANHKSIVGIPEIPKHIQGLFLTAHDLTPFDHVRMQCAFQTHCDNAVSKTVNLPNSATPKDINDVYMLAFENGAKGVTVYRDGCKSFQVLNLGTQAKKEEAKKETKEVESAGTVQVVEPLVATSTEAVERQTARMHGLGERSMYYNIQTGYGALHVHINYDDVGPTRVFANISPAGTEISGLTSAIAILLSKYLEQGGDPVRVLKHLNSVKGDKPYGFGPKRVDSIPHAISKALRDHLVKTGFIADENGQATLEQVVPATVIPVPFADEKPTKVTQNYCSKCFSNNVAMIAGCSEPTCYDCGHSKCS
jgi:ribonucleoside-diphosphate reductase alpha chain